MLSFIQYFNTPKKKSLLFIVIAASGTISSFLLKKWLAQSSYQSGPETIGLFIPAFLSTLFLWILGTLNNFTLRTLLTTLALLCIQYIPFGFLLFKVVEPNIGLDLTRYLLYAQNMIENKTLWGGDQLIFPDESRSYITQPGYRYFVALELLIFQKLYRFVSIVNIGIFISAIYVLLKIIHKKTDQTKLRLILSAIVILSVPYATKNILMGLPEWLTVVLLIYFAWFYFMKQNAFVAFIILALVPFLRQNLLPPVLLTFFIHIIIHKVDYKIIVAFILILLLPIYHNLYYAGECRFFTSVFQWPFLEYESSESTGFKIFQIFNNLMHYAGFDFNNNRIDFMEEGILMLTGFAVTYSLLGKHIEIKPLRKWFYLTTMISLIIPTLIMGTDFYPRFEFVVIYFTLVMFLQFKTIRKAEHLPSQ